MSSEWWSLGGDFLLPAGKSCEERNNAGSSGRVRVAETIWLKSFLTIQGKHSLEFFVLQGTFSFPASSGHRWPAPRRPTTYRDNPALSRLFYLVFWIGLIEEYWAFTFWKTSAGLIAVRMITEEQLWSVRENIYADKSAKGKCTGDSQGFPV